MASTSKRRKLRQAVESSDGSVSVLCYACRRTADPTVQRALSSFFAPSVRNVLRSSETASAEEELLLCSKCRRVMDMKRDSSGSGIASHTRVLPQIARMRSYQRIAADQHLPFVLKESEATGLMRQDCVLCGIPAPAEGHGLSRLCFWPEGLVRPERGGWMGPYHRDNLITACSMCNLMKGYRRPRAFVEAARHIATHRAGQGDFGLYPRRFRDNVSKRSRSCYITASSTHTKTHALTNEAFARIVGQPCRYCGKEPRPPHHYNGLDRLDSECRVYTEETCVACCGDCNVMKYKYSEERFIAHCLRIAQHNVGKDSFEGDVDEEPGGVDEELGAAFDTVFGEKETETLVQQEMSGSSWMPKISPLDPESEVDNEIEEDNPTPNPFAGFAHVGKAR